METWFTTCDAWTDLVTEDPTGQVQRGAITISGRLFKVDFVETLEVRAGGSTHLKFGLCMEKSGTIIQQHLGAKHEVYFDFPANPFRYDGNQSSTAKVSSAFAWPGGALSCTIGSCMRNILW